MGNSTEVSDMNMNLGNVHSGVCAPLIGGGTIRTQRHMRRWESKNLSLFQNDLGRLSGMVGERNAHLLGIVNHAVNACLGDDEIMQSILENSGTPPLSEEEVARALEKVREERGESNGRLARIPCGRRAKVPAVQPKRGIVRALINECGDDGLEGLVSLSPVQLPEGDGDDERRQRATLFLSRLYLPGDLLFVGGLTDTAVRPQTELVASLASMSPDLWPEYMGSNPFNGARRKANVAAFRFAVMESDPMPLEDQARFWCALARRKALPVAAITYSGNKSLHALLRLDAPSLEEFDRYWARLSARFASPLDPPCERFDASCRNPDRMTRLPEARNRKTGNLQRLLYLA